MERTERSRRRSAGWTLATAVVVGLVGGCGGEGSPDAHPPTASRPDSTPSASPASPTAASPAVAATSTAGDAQTAPVAAKPAVAYLPLRTWRTPEYGTGRIGVLLSPSRNIGCEFAEDGSAGGCGVMEDDTRPSSQDGYSWVFLEGRTARRSSRDDAPYYGDVSRETQVVEYGTTVATDHFACTSEQTGMTCWNRATGAAAVMSRGRGVRVFTKDVSSDDARGSSSNGSGAVSTARAGDPSDATILSGLIPSTIVPEHGPAGRMKNGTYDGFEPDNPGAYVKIARETSDWKSATVRYADIAGGPEREAVVLLSRSRGGVPWPDAVVAYDQAGRVVWAWDSGDAGGDPRGGATFPAVTDTSVTLRIIGTGANAGGANQSGESTYRLSKGTDGNPAFSLLSHTD